MDFKRLSFQFESPENDREIDAEKLKELVKNPETFAENSTILQSDFVTNSNGWSLILRGLVHSDSLAQKRSLYLLKRLVEHFSLDLKYFNIYFLVYETIDEKQAHIVKQVSSHICQIWKSITKQGIIISIDKIR